MRNGSNTSSLDAIIDLHAFDAVYAELSALDRDQADTLFIAFRKALEEPHKELKRFKHANDPGQIKYWLLKELLAVKAFMSNYLSVSETMALRESRLREAAMSSIDRFFDFLFEGSDRFFDHKQAAILESLESLNTPGNMLVDAKAKLFKSANGAFEALRQTTLKLDIQIPLPDRSALDDRCLIEKAIGAHLSPCQLKEGLAEVVEAVTRQFEADWKRVITEQTPDLEQVRAFASGISGINPMDIRIDLGVAEQTFAAGIAAGVIGSIGLAMGWHTIIYALLNVFPPIAIFTVIASVTLAFWQRDKMHDKRKSHVAQIMRDMKDTFKLAIFNEKQGDLEGRTLFETIMTLNADIIKKTVESWQSAICGKLTLMDYRKLIHAATEHLTCVEALIERLNSSRKD